MFILKFFFFLFIAFVLFVVLMAVALALRFRDIVKIFINGNRQANTQTASGNSYSNTTSSSQTTSSQSSERHTGKIFAPDEGEYVDFEEVP